MPTVISIVRVMALVCVACIACGRARRDPAPMGQAGSAGAAGGSQLPIHYPEDEPSCLGQERLSDVRCGLNQGGWYIERCPSGEWLLTDECSSLDECIDGTRRETDRPCGNDGVQRELCLDGRWADGDCLESGLCTSGAQRVGRTICGLNGRGYLQQLCVEQQWVDQGTCDDPDDCTDDERRTGVEACGPNDNGLSVEVCVLGRWVASGDCDGADECSNDLGRKGEACPGGGSTREVCVDGHWQLARGCDDCGDVKVAVAQVNSDEDAQDLAGVTWITGSLTIEQGVTTLQPLTSLRCVGELGVTATDLTSLEGLNSLVEAGDVFIQQSPNLTSLAGLEALEAVPGDFQIVDVPISDVSALSALESVSYLSIDSMPSLVSLDGLSKVRAWNIYISDAPVLTDLEGLRGARTRYLSVQGAPLVSNVYAVGAIAGLGSLTLEEMPLVTELPDPLPDSLFTVALDSLGVLDLSPLAALSDVSTLVLRQLPIASLDFMPGLSDDPYVTLYDNAALQNIHGLLGIARFKQLAIVRNDALADLSGLEQVTSIDTLSIEENAKLENLTGLGGAEAAGARLRVLRITKNPMLSSFEGIGARRVDALSVTENPLLASLSGIEAVEIGSLAVRKTPLLTNLQGLDGFLEGGYLTLEDNGELTSLSGLASVTTLAGLTVSRCPKSEDLSFDSIEAVLGSVTFRENALLGSISMNNVVVVNKLEISGNPLLTSVDFPALTSTSAVYVVDNPELATCAIDELTSQLAGEPTVTVSGNDDGAVCQ